jgi:hypothetical protein
MTTYDRPVKATLLVRLDNGEEWEPKPEDLAKFNLVDRHEAYMTFDDHLRRILHDAGLIGRDITDAQLNPVRYLVELAVVCPDLLNHPDTAETDAEVVALERALEAMDPDARGD